MITSISCAPRSQNSRAVGHPRFAILFTAAILCSNVIAPANEPAGPPNGGSAAERNISAQVAVSGTGTAPTPSELLQETVALMVAQFEKLLTAGEFVEARDVLSSTILLAELAYGQKNWRVRAARDLRDSVGKMATASPSDKELLRSARTFYASAQELQGERSLRAARDRFEEASKLYIRVLGVDNDITLNCLANLATVSYDLEDFDSAKQYWSDVLTARSQREGEPLPEQARVLLGLSDAEWRLGELESSEHHARQALKIVAPIIAQLTDDAVVRDVSWKAALNVARVQNDSGRFVDAQVTARGALTVLEIAQHPEHLNCTLCKLEIARSYAGQNKNEAARNLFAEIVKTLDGAPERNVSPDVFVHFLAPYAAHLRRMKLPEDAERVEERIAHFKWKIAAAKEASPTFPDDEK